jgi:Bacteriocin-protection, YdeI or OmpD-Associated/Domain of unknown function (DUF1905)
MTKHSFVAKLVRPEGVGTWAYMDLPFDAVAAFGENGRVKGTVNVQPYRSTAMPQGDGRQYMVVNKTIREAPGAVEGGTVQVVMEGDTAKRKGRVPPDFNKSLAANEAAKATSKRYTYWHQKEIVEWISGAKRAETRKRRIGLAIEKLADGTA